MPGSPITFSPENHSRPGSGVLILWCALVCLFALVVLSSLVPLGDTDIWWHLAVGRWIVEQHTVPFTDPFTVFGQNRTWFAYSWLFELIIYGFYQLAGLAGIVLYTILFSLALTALLFFMIRRRLKHDLYSIGLTAWAVLGMANIHTPRPWLLTILFFLLELAILDRVRRGHKPALLLWLLPLFVVWANVHIQFILGLGVLFLFALEPLLLPWARKGGLGVEDVQTPSGWIWLGLAGAILATLINPYVTGVYAVIWEIASQHNVPFASIMELQAPTFRSLPDWAALSLILTATFALGHKKALPLAPALLLLAGTFFFFRATRDVWFPTIVAVLILADSIPGPIAAACKPVIPRWLSWGVVLMGVAGVVLLSGRGRYLSNAVQGEEVKKRFPVAAADYLEKQQLTGRIFNHFNWGGYLIWRFPDGRITLDGRTNLHGEDRLERIGDTWSGGSKWAEDPELLNSALIVADRGRPLTALLNQAFRFTVLQITDNAVVFGNTEK